MANIIKSVSGVASIAGSTIYSVPAGATVTIIGLRASNTDAAAYHTITITVGGTQISSTGTRLPIGGAYEFSEGAKIVANGGQAIVATSDVDSTVDIHISMLEQT